MMKVNVDAAMSKNRSIAACAAVARTESGDFLGASVIIMEGALNPKVAEVLACREGMALASDIALHNFCLASNCLTVIRNLQGAGMGRYGQIIREIKTRTGAFTEVKFVYESRRSNLDAHVLARSSILNSVGRHVPKNHVTNIEKVIELDLRRRDRVRKERKKGRR
ncbi:hypothetical protein EJB05_14952, partial [Eragrostis curvula]